MYIRECTKILKYKDFSKYPRPLGPPASPPFGDMAGARAGTCRGGEGCGSVGEAWIAEQVAAGRMRRKRDGSVVAVR